jgi:asparagine synthase (glutamine-hydrolysing)
MAQQTDKPINTVSLKFNDLDVNQFYYAELVAKKYNTSHKTIAIELKDILNKIPDILNAIDHPSGNGINQFFIYEAIKNTECNILLNDMGGKELFAGYKLFKQLIHIKEKKWVLPFPKIFKKAFSTTYISKNKTAAAEIQMELLKLNYFDLPDVYPYIRLSLTDNHLLKLINKSVPQNKYYEWFHNLVGYDSKAFELPFISKISILEMLTHMQHTLLRNANQMAEAHFIENRFPLLDNMMVELALSIKDDYKYPDMPNKLFIDSIGDLLPKEIIDQQTENLFLPWDKWLKNELRSFVEEHLHSLQKRSIINAEYLNKMWQMFLNGDKRVTWLRIWYLVVLENWLTTHNVEFE